MRNLALKILTGLILTTSCFGQGYIQTPPPYWYVVAPPGPLASRPATCTANFHVYVCNGAGCTTNGEYHYCTAPNTWTVASGALGGPPTGAAGGVDHGGTYPDPLNTGDSGLYCADAGATDAYACNLTPAIVAYRTGQYYRFKANTINTGVATLQLNGIAGAKTIKKTLSGITTDLNDGDIQAGQQVIVVYDGTNMQMVSPPSAILGVSFGGTGSSTLAAAGIVTTTSVPGGYVPVCALYTVAYTNAAFLAAASSVPVTLFALPARGKLLGINIKHSVAFAGAGVTSTTVGVGDGATPYNQYASMFDIFQAVGATAFQDSSQFKSTTMAASNVVAWFVANTNFGNGAATVLTAGSVGVAACWVVLP